MSTLDKLVEWSNGHKARAVCIEIDNGYGAASWEVVLWHEKGITKAVEGAGEILLAHLPHGADLDLYNDQFEHVDVAGDEWVGLEATLDLALERVGGGA